MANSILASPPSGNYELPVYVTLTPVVATNLIRYTLDGTNPTAASPTFASPVLVQATSTLKAGEFDPNAPAPGPIRSAAFEYSIGESFIPSRSNLARTLGVFAAVCFLTFGIYALIRHHMHLPFLGNTSTDTQMALSSIYASIGLLLLVVIAFFIGDARTILYCILAEIAGCGAGWLFGIYFSPSGANETHAFQQAGVAVGTLLSGVVLSKVLRVIDTFLDPGKDADYGSVLILGSYFVAATIFVSVAVYVDRAYGPQFSVSAAPIDETLSEVITAENGICVNLTKKVTSDSENAKPLFSLLRSTNNLHAAEVHWSLLPDVSYVPLNPSSGLVSLKSISTSNADAGNNNGNERAELYFGHALGVDQGTQAYGLTGVWIGSNLFKTEDSSTAKDEACRSVVAHRSKDVTESGGKPINNKGHVAESTTDHNKTTKAPEPGVSVTTTSPPR